MLYKTQYSRCPIVKESVASQSRLDTAKAQVLKLREENQLLELGDGIPSLGQLGLQFTPISRKKNLRKRHLATKRSRDKRPG